MRDEGEVHAGARRLNFVRDCALLGRLDSAQRHAHPPLLDEDEDDSGFTQHLKRRRGNQQELFAPMPCRRQQSCSMSADTVALKVDSKQLEMSVLKIVDLVYSSLFCLLRDTNLNKKERRALPARAGRVRFGVSVAQRREPGFTQEVRVQLSPLSFAPSLR